MDSSIPIYPEVSCEVQDRAIGINMSDRDALDLCQIRLETYVRKKHTDGLYYLICFRRSVVIKREEYLLIDSMRTQDIFHKDIYQYAVRGIVDPTVMLVLGSINTPMFTLDPDQTPEEERLKKLYEA